jgi:GalNAc-alpha-(1->4)-GalNAc-alpha-(1->3)-diNAcBac-PP-undecaprenol alpha-1,4-N-acetyl-D-galactosaminyltransferase
MRKVVFIVHSLNVGGMERVVSLLLTQFEKNDNLELHLILLNSHSKIFYSIPPSIIIHRPTFEFSGLRFFYTIKVLLFIRKTLTNLQAESILSFGEYWNNLVLLSTFGKKMPIFVSDRSRPGKPLGSLHEWLRKALYPKAKGIIAQTNEAKKELIKRVKNTNIQVIGNPFESIINSRKIEKENIILTVGRLIETKHHDKLIECFVKLNIPNWKLVIVGDDGLKQKNKNKLEELIINLNAEKNVVLTGKMSDVNEFYLRSEIFAFMSSSEGFPNVVGEALSSGLPVISFNCIAGPSELIVDGYNGYLIPLFDFNLFEQKLLTLITDTNIRNVMKKNAKVSIEKFSLELIANKYLKMILPNEDFTN